MTAQPAIAHNPQPGQHFILRRPYGGKDEPDKFWLVEVGSRKPPRPYSSDNPADQIEVIWLGRCDEQGNMLHGDEKFGQISHWFVAPGVVLDTRFYTPIRVEKAEAA